VQNYEFVNYDDPSYVTANYQIQSGITFESIKSAFSDISTSNWHPLTIMSHMLDWQLFSDRAGGHHWTNLIIHIFNTILLFLLFNIMTKAMWRSAFVAALFAIHPLNVESVAWIAERKNVLSTFFLILTILFYVWYVKSPNWKRYLPVFICFVLGLMSKPMLVTLPFVLLLIDYWPLNRLLIDSQRDDHLEIKELVRRNSHKIFNLVLEKVPLLFLSIISIYSTLHAARHMGTVSGFESIPLFKRISNAIVSYALYIKKLFWPTDLAVFYPISDIPIWQFLIALLFLVSVTIFVCRYFRRYPYLFVGWFWYLGILVPVIGLIQVGSQSMADRYAYVPLIGIFIMMAWGMPQILFRLQNGKLIAASVASAFILVITLATYMQVGTWKNNLTLFGHALNVDRRNYQAYSLLGLAMADKGDYEKAIYYEYMALKYNAKFYPAYNYAGTVLEKMGKLDEAINCYKKALQIDDKSIEANYNLGILLIEKNNFNESIFHFKKALEMTPDDSDIHNNLGVVLLKNGNSKEALAHFREALRLNPQGETVRKNIKIATAAQKKDIIRKHSAQ
jgi:tetratricopeptide (TPR) repeat protein